MGGLLSPGRSWTTFVLGTPFVSDLGGALSERLVLTDMLQCLRTPVLAMEEEI